MNKTWSMSAVKTLFFSSQACSFFKRNKLKSPEQEQVWASINFF